MPERDGYIPGVPCWVDTTQPDPQAAASFYGAIFGWELEDTMPPEVPATTSSRASAGWTLRRSVRRHPARHPAPLGTPTSGSTAPTRPRSGCWGLGVQC
jgi:hypothetical protein